MAETLKGSTNIYAAINVIDEPREFGAATSRSGQKYWLGTVDGRGFICTKEFYDAYKAGTLYQVTYTKTKYDRPDPVTGEKVPRDSATLGGYLTKSQYIAMLEGDVDLVKAEAKLKAIERSAGKMAEMQIYKDADLSPEEIKQLEALA